MPAADVRQAHAVGEAGLDAAQVEERRLRWGPNRLRSAPRRGPLLRLLLQFHNVLLYVMLGAAAITAALGHWVDTGVLLAAVVVNAIIGFVQEGKAEAAMAAIRNMLAPKAAVLRDGWEVVVLPLEPAAAGFVGASLRGEPLGAAAAAGAALDAQFDLGRALARLLQHQALVAFTFV